MILQNYAQEILLGANNVSNIRTISTNILDDIHLYIDGTNYILKHNGLDKLLGANFIPNLNTISSNSTDHIQLYTNGKSYILQENGTNKLLGANFIPGLETASEPTQPSTEILSENQKYNNFLNSSYRLDVSGSRFTWLHPNGTPADNIKKTTKIIKSLFDDDGVVFTPEAWIKVKNYIFDYQEPKP